MKILPTRSIDNNTYSTVITPTEMGNSTYTAEQEIELLADFPQTLRYSDIDFTGNFVVTDGLPVISDEDGSVEISLALNNREFVIGEDLEISLSINADKITSAEIDDTVLTDSLLVAQAKVILFETKVIAKIKELLEVARSHVNTFEETVEQTL